MSGPVVLAPTFVYYAGNEGCSVTIVKTILGPHFACFSLDIRSPPFVCLRLISLTRCRTDTRGDVSITYHFN